MKFAVKHDDRIDCLAMAVKYFTDALSISAQKQIDLRKEEEWNDILQGFLDDPQSSANHLVLGMDVNQRQQARGKATGKEVPNWS
tara:strand:+ start:49 stop:303 length:255 start_codon:yes stop_codon:yes gene_type:complete